MVFRRAKYRTLKGRKEGHVFFNDALNTFYLQLYGVKHMVMDHSDSEKGNPLPPHRLLFPINTRVLLYAPSHRQDCTYHGLCYTSRGALARTRNRSMGPPHEGSIRRLHRTMSERSYQGATSQSRTLSWSCRVSNIVLAVLECTILYINKGYIISFVHNIVY